MSFRWMKEAFTVIAWNVFFSIVILRMMKRSLAVQICRIYPPRTLPLDSSSSLEEEEEAAAALTVRMTLLMLLWLRWRWELSSWTDLFEKRQWTLLLFCFNSCFWLLSGPSSKRHEETWRKGKREKVSQVRFWYYHRMFLRPFIQIIFIVYSREDGNGRGFMGRIWVSMGDWASRREVFFLRLFLPGVYGMTLKRRMTKWVTLLKLLPPPYLCHRNNCAPLLFLFFFLIFSIYLHQFTDWAIQMYFWWWSRCYF